MQFASDNWAGVAPEVMDAIVKASQETMPAYGSDPITERLLAQVNNTFECDAEIFLVLTGGAANGLALSVLTPPYGMIFCHEESHIEMDECAGPEFFTGGAKLATIKAPAAKLTVEAFADRLAGFPDRPPHGAPPRVLSLTQLTECGTAYSIDELTPLTALAHERGMSVHMDGARFANALVHLGVSPAEMSWKAGVDVLCLGGTKNGCLAAEMVIFFDKEKASDFAFRRKRAGQLLSKHRFLSAQFEAWFTDDLWLRLAHKANSKAQKLSRRLNDIDGVEVCYPTEGNEVFAMFPGELADHLRSEGCFLYPWITPGDPVEGRMQRMICSFATTDEQIEAFLARVRAG